MLRNLVNNIKMLYSIAFFLAFSLYFIYDINSVLWKNRMVHKFFIAGTLILIITTAIMICESHGEKKLISSISIGMNMYTLIVVVLMAVFALLLIYSLFMELPFKKTYLEDLHNKKVDEDKKPKAYKEGTYALCRHPGVLWFAGLYFCISMVFPTSTVIVNSIFAIALNVVYIAFQDGWTFVRTFDDYLEYKRIAPFLIPNAGSIRNCLQSIKSTKG